MKTEYINKKNQEYFLSEFGDKASNILNQLIKSNDIYYTKERMDECESNYTYGSSLSDNEFFYLSTNDERFNDKKIMIPIKTLQFLIYESLLKGNSLMDFETRVEIDLKEDYDSWEAPCCHISKSKYYAGNVKVKMKIENKTPDLEVLCEGKFWETGWR